MRSADEIGRILAAQSNRSQKTLFFSALLAAEADNPGMVVVGGSAIEIYTQGAYVSGDIDVVGDRPRLLRVLENWGFKKEGRIWHHTGWALVVDVPSLEYHGSFDRTRLVSTPFGGVRLAAVEDLLVSRLISSRYWEIPKDFDHAVLLAIRYRSSVDWDYVVERATFDQVQDLVPLVRERALAVSGEAGSY